MRFVKQTVLYFKEGTSDKTYEIDLCETGPGQYIVNFRYGKRGASLKEGSKTATPVSQEEATAIFDALEKEKRSKGYTGEQDGVATTAYTSVPVDDVADPTHKAILKRLDDAVTGKQSFKTKWSTSRVIWAAGELKIRAAAPVILRLIEKGNAMQRYAAIWALGRCGDPVAVSLVSSYIDNSTYPPYLRQMAANAVLQLLTGEERTTFITRFLHALPPEFQEAINGQHMQVLTQLLDQRVIQLNEATYQLLEDLYIVAADNIPVRQILYALFAALPLRPSYFRHIRHLYKQAEMRDDHGLTALFSVRFERERHLFSTSGKPPAELKKPMSKLAYSNRTRRHFRNRTLRHLKELGQRTDVEYVKLATALLLQYDGNLYKEAAYSRNVYQYDYTTRRYTTRTIRYPANSSAVYLNYILRGNQPDLHLVSGNSCWEFRDPETEKPAAQTKAAPPKKEGFLQQISNIFKTPKKDEGIQPKESLEKVVKESEEPHSDIPYRSLWHQLPQAFIQLLISGRMEEIHAFAYTELQASPQYEAIKEKIDANVIAGLLINPYQIPQRFGLSLAKEKYNPAAPSLPLFVAMMNSPFSEARELGIEWIRAHIGFCFQDTEFIAALIFAAYDDVRQIAIDRLSTTLLPLDKSRVIIGRAVSILLAQRQPNEAVYNLLNKGCRVLEQYLVAALQEIDTKVVADLLQSGIPPAEAFGVRLLLLQKQPVQLSDELIAGILENAYQPVREGGIAILGSLSNDALITRPALLLQVCTASYTDVRQGIRPVLARLVKEYNDLAVWLVNELVPLLMRTETSEGLHNDIANILGNELVGHLHDIDKATALRLTYSNYRATQAFGVLVLEKYIPPAALTLKQVIATGNHELREVREWCWRFFEQQLPRIRYERDDAIGLLDAKWDDTRTFAMQFFRTHFRDEDWTPETLVAIADSVHPIVQAFGRELLTRFFKAEDGLSYLLKLSQHPGVNMQTFATNYLAQYAAGQLERLQELEFYFRSVLSRVNKARVAKERIFAFLEQESLKSDAAAQYIAGIIAHISATVAIGDKARCIRIMRNIHQQYPDIMLPVQFIAIPEHSS
ncbi:HEAT repeat domain-containing protein [Chitinophaga sp.]|uniref:HEAT repeat domain-containing protein n=1 Tax=Chitinophaga sp. TaxID=1869181 RepID=UPI0031E4581F